MEVGVEVEVEVEVGVGVEVEVEVEDGPHPAGEEGAVLELAQVEGDEEGPGHEHQGQQGRVGLAQHVLRHRAVTHGDRRHRQVLERRVATVAEGTALQRVLLEDL